MTVVVLNDAIKRESGRSVLQGMIAAATAGAEIIRTTLGPRSMHKMLLDAAGSGIVVTNDGNAILRDLDVQHPAAKAMVELSRAQEEEAGDGTTSVIVLAAEMLRAAEPLVALHAFHPSIVCRGFARALEDSLAALESAAFSMDVEDHAALQVIVRSCLGGKFTGALGDLVADMAIDAVKTVAVDLGNGSREIDVKKYVKIEKVAGGRLEDSAVLRGVMINKDVVAPGRMRRKITNPRVVLLDCPLEYKKGENATNVEVMEEEDWSILLKLEEEFVEEACKHILTLKPDLVITEKGLSDLACHHLSKAGVSAIRRVRKTDTNRIARACGATIVNRPEELQERDVGTGAGLFEVRKIGDEFFAFLIQCQEPRACTVLLRGASQDILNEVERNLHDAMCVVRNTIRDHGKMVAGGGACEMAVSAALKSKACSVEGIEQWAYRAAAQALEVIPRTLAQNCGVAVIRTMTELQARHAEACEKREACSFGIEGRSGKIVDMKEAGVWDAFGVKAQVIKSAIEAATMLLRIDDVVSGIKKKKERGAQGPSDDAGDREDIPE
ncbi:T-complex protein 1 subunit gamma [Selaginella moellendorffii]|nr:T-complex protein 1 subunit gamma [Selaginella moellendorffii]|eukprot:XP_002966909.2 T-complex protein 1 subunit gamma [Selaginella moellendorffii]